MTLMTAKLVTGNPGNLVPVGSESNLKLEIINLFPVSRNVSVRWTLTPVSGSATTGSSNITIGGLNTAYVQIPLTGQSLGHRWIDYTITWSTGHIAERAGFVYTRAIANQVRDTTGFEWGMNPGFGAYESDYEAMKNIGITSVRTYFDWQYLEFPNNWFHWYGADKQIELAEKFNMRIMWVFAFGNIFATPFELHFNPFVAAPHSAYWKNFLSKLTARYGTRITWYELWSKPNIPLLFEGDSSDYLRVLRDGYNAIKAVNPKALICTGGFADENIPSANSNVQRRTLQEASAHYNIHAFHARDTFAAWEASIAVFQPWRDAMTIKRPLWVNEAGMTAAGAVFTPSIWLDQARETVKKIVAAKAYGMIGYTIADAVDLGLNLIIDEINFGVITITRQPKPAYGAINETINRIRHYGYYGTLSVGSNGRLYIFKGPRGFLTCFWRESGSVSNLKVEVGVGATAADMWGNALTMGASGTQMTLTFDVLPRWIESKFPPTIPAPVTTVPPEPPPIPEVIIDPLITTGPANTHQVNALHPFARLRCRERTEQSGFVVSFNDVYKEGHKWEPVDTNKVLPPTQRQKIGWRDACSFTGLQQYRSNLPASQWSFIHNNQPHEIFIVLLSKVTSNSTGIARTISSTLEHGWRLSAAALSGIITSSVYGNVGQSVSTVSPVLANGSAVFIRIRSNTSLSPQESMITNESSTSGASYSFTPTADNPAVALTIGDGTGNGFELAEVIVFDRALTDAERDVVIDYINNWYDLLNLSDYVNSLLPFARIRARERTEVSGRVSAFNDLAQVGHALNQGASLNQVIGAPRNAYMYDREIASFTGAQQYASNIASSLWDFLHKDGEKEVFLVILTVVNGVTNTILTTSVNRLSHGFTIQQKTNGEVLLGVGHDLGQQTVVLSQSLTNNKPAVLDLNSIEDGNSPTFRLVTNSEEEVTADYSFTPIDISTSQTLLLGDTTSDQFKFAEFIIFNRRLTPSERQNVRRYVAAWYNIAAPVKTFTEWPGSGTINPAVFVSAVSNVRNGIKYYGKGVLTAPIVNMTFKGRKTSYGKPKTPLTVAISTTGNIKNAPGVASAEALSPRRVRLQFDARMVPDSILRNPLNYQISPVFEGGVEVFVKSVIVPAGGFPLYIDLDVSEMTNAALYSVEITSNFGSPVNQYGIKLSSGRKEANFLGIAEAPTVLYVASIGPNRIDVKFSKVMLNEDSIRNPQKYQWSDGLQTISVLGVVSDVVQLVTTDQIPGHKYTLTISG